MRNYVFSGCLFLLMMGSAARAHSERIEFRSRADALRFSRDGSKLLATSVIHPHTTFFNPYGFGDNDALEADKRLRVYNVPSAEQCWILPTQPISSPDSSRGLNLLLPDFKTLITSWGAQEIKPVDIHSYRVGTPIPVFSGAIGSFELSPDETLLAIGITRAVEFRDAKSYEILRTYGHGGQIPRVRFGPDSRVVMMFAGGDKPHVISTQTAQQIRWPRWAYRVEDADAFAFSRDGKRLVRSKNGVIELWTTPTNDGGRKLQSWKSKFSRILALQFSPDGRTLAAGGLTLKTVPIQIFTLLQ